MMPAGLVIARPLIEAIERAVEAAYPEEACGLLVGRADDEGRLVVTRVEPSANVAEGDRRVAFEVDPAVRFAVMRGLEETNQRIIGHYHSHPDHPPEPSARDRAMTFEPDLVWLIVAVTDGWARASRAFAVVPDGSDFTPLAILDAPGAARDCGA